MRNMQFTFINEATTPHCIPRSLGERKLFQIIKNEYDECKLKTRKKKTHSRF